MRLSLLSTRKLPSRPLLTSNRSLRLGQARHYLYAVAAVSVSVAIAALLEAWLPSSVASLSLVFLLGVLVVAAHTAFVPALTTALLGFLAYNYFFTEPRFTLAVTRADELVAVTLFLVTGVIAGNLASRMARHVAALRTTNDQSRRLLALHHRLAGSSTPDAIHAAAVDALAEFVSVPVCTLARSDPGGHLHVVTQAPTGTILEPADLCAAQRAVATLQVAGLGTPNAPQTPWRFTPLLLGETPHGVLGLKLGSLAYPPTEEELQLIAAYATHVAQALTRAQLTQSVEEARVAQETERLRSALLSSVSHDLRTPLASIIGTASSLRELSDRLSPTDRQELLDGLLSEGHRLNRYIGNLLDMTRLGQGSLALERDWVAAADLIGAVVRRTREIFLDLEVERDIPADLPLLYVHAALIEQALVNVLENAARFSPSGVPVSMAAHADCDRLTISVTDAGPGIAESERQRVFEMFYIGESPGSEPQGSGLGLAICHGMVAAHGGSVVALPAPGGTGTRISIKLPVTAPPHDETGVPAKP